MERPKTYCIVRKDLPPELQLKEAQRAIDAAGARFGCSAGELVLLTVGSEHDLLREFITVKSDAVCKFESRLDSYTSFATTAFAEQTSRFGHLERLTPARLSADRELVFPE